MGCGCGERIVLLGREGDWHGEEERLSFPCAGCGGEVALAERAGEAEGESDFIGALVRKVKRSDN